MENAHHAASFLDDSNPTWDGDWKEAYYTFRNQTASLSDQNDKLTSENALLREQRDKLLGALRSIANNTCCGTCQEAALVARAAISEAEGRG